MHGSVAALASAITAMCTDILKAEVQPGRVLIVQLGPCEGQQGQRYRSE